MTAIDPQPAESAVGSALMPIFGVATIIATIAICLVIAFPTVVTLVVALATVIGFATGIVVLLSRIIGREDTH